MRTRFLIGKPDVERRAGHGFVVFPSGWHGQNNTRTFQIGKQHRTTSCAAGPKGISLRFEKIGAGRATRIELPNLTKVYDPATDDPLITGQRDRLLLPNEIFRILPELKVGDSGTGGWQCHRFWLMLLPTH